ncbi:hypothetical protein [Promicromonospora soli]
MGAQRRVLVKSATALETAARIDTPVMGKPRTLTSGEPEVADVVADGLDEFELLSLAAAVERESEHPLAPGHRPANDAVARAAGGNGHQGVDRRGKDA